MTSVWNATDASLNGMTLSNGNLTFMGPTNNTSIRATVSKTTGKWYVEFLAGATSYMYFGVASSGFNAGDYLGNSLYSAGVGYGYNPVSTGFTSNVTLSQVPFAADVWGLAVDFTAGSLWVAQNNTWASGNPATGTSPTISFVPATVGALFPTLSVNNTNGNSTWTLQPTAASQKYAPPSGFSAWDSVAAAQARVMVMA